METNFCDFKPVPTRAWIMINAVFLVKFKILYFYFVMKNTHHFTNLMRNCIQKNELKLMKIYLRWQLHDTFHTIHIHRTVSYTKIYLIVCHFLQAVRCMIDKALTWRKQNIFLSNFDGPISRHKKKWHVSLQNAVVPSLR